jgi:outer membrane protein OmpA-like peptidoglycan-associated protein
MPIEGFGFPFPQGVGMNRMLSSLVVVFSALMFLWPAAAKGEDCRKARQHYEKGSRLLNYEERRQAFQAAVDLCPSFAEAHVNLADALENLALCGKEFGRENLQRNNALLDRAIKEYQEALKYNPRLFVAYLGLAENLTRIGLYAKAKESYAKALAINSAHPLERRARDGLEAVNRMMAREKDGFKNSQEIVSRFKQSSRDSSVGTIMGFEEFTAMRDRQRFINIVFDEWSSQLSRKETLEQLKEIGSALASPEMARCRFVVEGHTDDRGGYERNMMLSMQRAEAVKNYLASTFGIQPTRITSQGFGYDRPRFPNDTPEHLLGNRRVELLIIEDLKDKRN